MEKEFDTIPVPKLVLKLGIPALFAQFFNILYSIVDRIFVGNIPEYGELALASIGVCAPAVTAVTAFAFMVGTGGSALMSMSLGRKDRETAQHTVNNAFLMIGVIALAVTVLALIFKRPLLYLLGCSDAMYPYASTYFTIYILGTFAVLYGMGMNQFVLAQGLAKEGMLSVVLGAIVNTVLDPVFIYGLKMGIAGAAIATVIAQICTMLYVLAVLNGRKACLHIQLGQYQRQIIRKILAIGVMPFMITILDNMILILLNMQLRKYGGDVVGDQYIACAAIVQSFMVLVSSPAQGLTTGCATLYSYHYGAGNFRKCMQVYQYVFLVCASYILVLTVFSQAAPEFFVRMFARDGGNVVQAASFLSKYTLGIVGIAVQYALVDGTTAMGKVKLALPMSLFRKFIYIGCLFILPMITGLENIFLAGTISDVVGSLFSIAVFFTIVRPAIFREIGSESL